MQVYISEKFLEQNGLGVFEKWLTKVSVGEQGESVEPSIALRKAIFDILLSLNVRGFAIVTIGLCAAWLALSVMLGRKFKALTPATGETAA